MTTGEKLTAAGQAAAKCHATNNSMAAQNYSYHLGMQQYGSSAQRACANTLPAPPAPEQPAAVAANTTATSAVYA
jgi:hypothetical protein